MRHVSLAVLTLLLASGGSPGLSGASAQPDAFYPPVPQLPQNVNNEVADTFSAGATLEPLARWGYGYARSVAFINNGIGVTMQGSVLQTLDLSTPGEVSVIGELEFPGVISDMATRGNVVYLMLTHFQNSETGLFIVNVNNPEQPVLRGKLTGLAATSISVLGDYAYVGTYNATEGPNLSLRVISVASGTNPEQVAAIETPSFADDISFYNGRAYLALNSAGLGVVDISTPEAPVLLDSPVTTYVGAVGVSPQGTLAVGQRNSAGTGFLTLYDIEDSGGLTEQGAVTLASRADPLDLVWSGTDIVLAGLFGGLHFVDASNPLTPVLSRRSQTNTAFSASGTNRVAIQNDLFLISDFYSGVHRGSVSRKRLEGFLQGAGLALDLVVDDETDIIYSAQGGSGVMAVERIVPTGGGPERLEPYRNRAHTAEWNYTTDVALQLNHLYAADGFAGIWAIDKTTMTTTANVLRNTPIRTVSVTEDGEFLLALDDAQTVHILSLDNPAVPVEIATIIPPAGAADVGGTGPVIWVSDVNDTRLRLYDMSNPSAPAALPSLDLRGSRFRLARTKDRLYANGAGGFITVVDVSDPSAAEVTGAFDVTGSNQVPLAGQGDVLVVAGNGVYAYNVADVPSMPPFPRLQPTAESSDIGDVVTGVAFLQQGVAALSVGHAGVSTFATPIPTVGETPAPLAGELRVSVAPNPSSGAVTVEVASGTPEAVDVAVFDVLGRRVRTLTTTLALTSPEALLWDGRSDAGMPLAPGVYVVRAQTASGTVATARMTLVR